MNNNVHDDTDAWLAYPEHRWIFNKLEVALKLGYEAGPACVPVRRSDNYIIRPIYNLYGMGIGAHTQYLLQSDGWDMMNHAHIPPGYFWCEMFEGDHLSIDFKRTKAPIGSSFCWESFCTMIGETDKNCLTKFKSWVKIENKRVLLPLFCNHLDGVDNLNIEMIGGNIIEIHLRTGNDVVWDMPVGTKLVPVWNGDSEEINIKNEDPDCVYDASGYLEHVRIGYRIEN